MEDRNEYARICTGEGHEKWKQTKNLVTQKCKQAKELWINELCKNLEKDLKDETEKAYNHSKRLQCKTKTN